MLKCRVAQIIALALAVGGAAEIEVEKGLKGCSLAEIGSPKLIAANFWGSLFHNNWVLTRFW